MLTNDGLQFLNISDGATIWQHDWAIENYRVLQPCVVGQSIYFATSSQEGTRKITVSRDEDGSWDLREDWTSRNLKSDYNDFVYHAGALYGFDGGVFASIDADSGDRNWKRGRYGNGQVLLLTPHPKNFWKPPGFKRSRARPGIIPSSSEITFTFEMPRKPPATGCLFPSRASEFNRPSRAWNPHDPRQRPLSFDRPTAWRPGR